MEQAFQSLQQSWERKVFKLTKLIPNVCQKKNPQCGETQEKKTFVDFEPTENDLQQNSCGRGTFTIMGT